MASTRTITTFAIPLIILVLATLSTMQPVRANVMTIYSNHQTWNICVASQSTSTNYLYSNAGPSSTTLWVVQVSIGLNGGDNTQYANWGFIIDPNDHASYFGAANERELTGEEYMVAR